MIKQIAVCDMCGAEAALVHDSINLRDRFPVGWFDITEVHSPPGGEYRTTKRLLCSLVCAVNCYHGWLGRENERV